MRLKRPTQDARNKLARAAALIDIDAHLKRPGVRPCDGCERPCSCQKGPKICDCGCGPDCEEAARRLSSDPERYPVEEKILPLALGLARLGHVSPCWSCEGHPLGGSRPERLPQVWFYLDDVGIATLLAEFLQRCWIQKIVRHRWQLRILALGDVYETIFAIEPESPVGRAPLEELQADALALGGRICEDVRKLIDRTLSVSSIGEL